MHGQIYILSWVRLGLYMTFRERPARGARTGTWRAGNGGISGDDSREPCFIRFEHADLRLLQSHIELGFGKKPGSVLGLHIAHIIPHYGASYIQRGETRALFAIDWQSKPQS